MFVLVPMYVFAAVFPPCTVLVTLSTLCNDSLRQYPVPFTAPEQLLHRGMFIVHCSLQTSLLSHRICVVPSVLLTPLSNVHTSLYSCGLYGPFPY